MWFMTILLVILAALILIVIMDTSMKLALMITTLYNYDTKKLFIPATLTVGLWGALLLGCFAAINKSLDGNLLDILFTMIFEQSIFVEYFPAMIKQLISTFLIGTLLQSLTYYTVNINYQKLTGTVRFSIKQFIKKMVKKILKKDIFIKEETGTLSEITRGPKKLTFLRAIITSVISVIITLFACVLLFVLGMLLSGKVLTKI